MVKLSQTEKMCVRAWFVAAAQILHQSILGCYPSKVRPFRRENVHLEVKNVSREERARQLAEKPGKRGASAAGILCTL